MKEKEIVSINPMMCDPVTGMCEVPETSLQDSQLNKDGQMNEETGQKPVRLLYFTDPICSSCWGIEPQLRKLKMEYGDYIDVDYRMGGLLKSWDTYGGRDVSGPASVAQHWEEASNYYGMPIDGDVWLKDPLDSSYPPSIAFKAAQMQNKDKALTFMRRIREMVFLEKKNITRLEHLLAAAVESGLDGNQFRSDYEGQAKKLFEEDLALARALGVRGFPSIFFLDDDGNRFLVYGSKPYDDYVQALLKLQPDARKKEYDADPQELFQTYSTLTTKEFSVLTNLESDQAEDILNRLFNEGEIEKSVFKKGVLWKRK